ncbi:hypothetical protein IFT82_16345 [Sphingomonas sp. CFBP 8760]|nr:hypothetical protein [Sphingomonas sp. CFBP 8760]
MLKEHASGLRGRCPAHRDPSRSLYVSTVLDRFHCFGCGAGGDAVRWIMMRDRIDRGSAEVRLARWRAGGSSGHR